MKALNIVKLSALLMALILILMNNRMIEKLMSNYLYSNSTCTNSSSCNFESHYKDYANMVDKHDFKTNQSLLLTRNMFT